MTRALVITVVIVTVQWTVIHRYPDPKWLLLVVLAVPALLLALSVSGVVGLTARWRRGGGRR